jgi:hypothetical protein
MLKVTLRFLRAGAGELCDDIINVYDVADVHDLFRVVYRPGDGSRRFQFECQLTRAGLLSYVSDILKSMKYDVDPFDRIQVLTDMHPSVMYPVADMEDPVTRRNIEDLVYSSLRTRVRRVRYA